METSELQRISKEIVEMVDKKKGIERSDLLTIAQLVEEFGELAEAINFERFKKGKIRIEAIEEEFADVFILLAALASDFGIDLEKAVLNKIEILKNRHKLVLR